MSAKADFQDDTDETSIAAEFDDLRRALVSIGPLQEQVHDLTARVTELEEAVEDDDSQDLEEIEEFLSELAEGIYDVEGRVDDIDTRLDEVSAQLDALVETQENLDDRLTAVEAMFSDTLLQKEAAHCEAQERDTEEVVQKGEEYELVVEETLYEQPDPTVRGRIDGLQIFADVNNREYEEGDLVDIVITDLQDTCANGMEV